MTSAGRLNVNFERLKLHPLLHTKSAWLHDILNRYSRQGARAVSKTLFRYIHRFQHR